MLHDLSQRFLFCSCELITPVIGKKQPMAAVSYDVLSIEFDLVLPDMVGQYTTPLRLMG